MIFSFSFKAGSSQGFYVNHFSFESSVLYLFILFWGDSLSSLPLEESLFFKKFIIVILWV